MTMKVVLSCPIIDCDEGEKHEAFTTPVMGIQVALKHLSVHCKYSHAQWRGAISAQYLCNMVSEETWLNFLSSWAAYRSLECEELGDEELFTHLMDRRLLLGVGVATLVRIRWDEHTMTLTDLQLLDEVALTLWGSPEDPDNAVVAPPVEGGVEEVMDKSTSKCKSEEALQNRAIRRKRAKAKREEAKLHKIKEYGASAVPCLDPERKEAEDPVIERILYPKAIDQPAGGTSRIILSSAGSSSGGDKAAEVDNHGPGPTMTGISTSEVERGAQNNMQLEAENHGPGLTMTGISTSEEERGAQNHMQLEDADTADPDTGQIVPAQAVGVPLVGGQQGHREDPQEEALALDVGPREEAPQKLGEVQIEPVKGGQDIIKAQPSGRAGKEKIDRTVPEDCSRGAAVDISHSPTMPRELVVGHTDPDTVPEVGENVQVEPDEIQNLGPGLTTISISTDVVRGAQSCASRQEMVPAQEYLPEEVPGGNTLLPAGAIHHVGGQGRGGALHGEDPAAEDQPDADLEEEPDPISAYYSHPLHRVADSGRRSSNSVSLVHPLTQNLSQFPAADDVVVMDPCSQKRRNLEQKGPVVVAEVTEVSMENFMPRVTTENTDMLVEHPTGGIISSGDNQGVHLQDVQPIGRDTEGGGSDRRTPAPHGVVEVLTTVTETKGGGSDRRTPAPHGMLQILATEIAGTRLLECREDAPLQPDNRVERGMGAGTPSVEEEGGLVGIMPDSVDPGNQVQVKEPDIAEMCMHDHSPGAPVVSYDEHSPSRDTCLGSRAKHMLSSLIYFLLFCLMTAGGAFRYQAFNSYHAGECRDECGGAVSGTNNSIRKMVHMSQVGSHDWLTRGTQFNMAYGTCLYTVDLTGDMVELSGNITPTDTIVVGLDKSTEEDRQDGLVESNMYTGARDAQMNVGFIKDNANSTDRMDARAIVFRRDNSFNKPAVCRYAASLAGTCGPVLVAMRAKYHREVSAIAATQVSIQSKPNQEMPGKSGFQCECVAYTRLVMFGQEVNRFQPERSLKLTVPRPTHAGEHPIVTGDESEEVANVLPSPGQDPSHELGQHKLPSLLDILCFRAEPRVLIHCDLQIPVSVAKATVMISTNMRPLYQKVLNIELLYKQFPQVVAEIYLHNQLKAELLTGQKTGLEEDTLAVIGSLHSKGMSTVILSGIELGKEKHLVWLVSQAKPAVVEAGDSFTAHDTGWLARTEGGFETSFGRTYGTMQTVPSLSLSPAVVAAGLDKSAPVMMEPKFAQSREGIDDLSAEIQSQTHPGNHKPHGYYEIVGGVAGFYTDLVYKPVLISGMVGMFRAEPPDSVCAAAINRALISQAGVTMWSVHVYAIDMIAVAHCTHQDECLWGPAVAGRNNKQ